MEQVTPSYNYANTLPEGANNYGFSIERVTREGQAESRPVDEVCAGWDEYEQDASRRLAEGDGLRVLKSTEEPTSEERVRPLLLSVEIPQTKYDKKVSDGAVKPNEWSFYTAEQADKEGLHVAFASEEQEAILEAARRQAVHEYSGDMGALPSFAFESVKRVSEVFEFEAWGQRRRLYNFTETRMSDRQLAKVMNVVREQVELTGGVAIERLAVMAILPEESRCWKKDEDGNSIDSNGMTKRSAVMFNERVFKPGKRTSISSPDESHVVGGGELETMVFHEMTHVIEASADVKTSRTAAEQAGWDLGGLNDAGHTLRDPKASPSPYGRKTPGEHIAEMGTARFIGGEWEARVSPEGKLAVQGLYAAQHSGRYGPAFVRCTEIDIHNLPHKIGLDLRGKVAFRPEVSFRITKS